MKAIEHKILLLGDWHIGKRFTRDEMGGNNEFSYKVARERLELLLSKLRSVRNKPETLQVFTLGDLIEGNIRRHEGFELTTEQGEYSQVAVTIEYMAWFLERLSKIFKKVNVNSVVGNHGRSSGLSKVPNTRVENNADWLVMDQVRKNLLKDTKNVTITNHKDPFPLVKLTGGFNALVTHGDRNGIANSGATKLSTSFAKAIADHNGTPINLIAVGHLHHNKYEEVGSQQALVMNASLCGTDPYAKNNLMLSGVAAQTLLTIEDKKVKNIDVMYLN